MAEALARRLLSEIHVETLDSLLTSFRALNPSTPRPTNIPQLDSLINNTLFPPPPPERDPLRDGSPDPAAAAAAAAEEASRLSAARATTRTAKQKTKDQPLSIEIISHQPFTGRTQLTLLLTAQSLLGTTTAEEDHDHDHQPSTVVWIDADRRLSVPRLYRLLLAELRARRRPLPPSSSTPSPTPAPGPRGNEPTPEELSAAEQALGHLHIFRPTSFSSLLATLAAVPDAMLDANTHLSGGRVLSHVVVSGVTAFHWNERARLEGPSGESGAASTAAAALVAGVGVGVAGVGGGDGGAAASTSTAPTTGSIADRYQSVVVALKDIQKTLHCHVVCSRVEGTARLPRAWDEWVDVSLVLDKVKGRLPPGIGVERALEMERIGPRLVGKVVVGAKEEKKKKKKKKKFGLNVWGDGVGVSEIEDG